MERKNRRKRKLGEGLLQSAGVESVGGAEDRISLLLESFQMSSDRTPDSSQFPKGHTSLWTAGGGLQGHWRNSTRGNICRDEEYFLI